MYLFWFFFSSMNLFLRLFKKRRSTACPALASSCAYALFHGGAFAAQRRWKRRISHYACFETVDQRPPPRASPPLLPQNNSEHCDFYLSSQDDPCLWRAAACTLLNVCVTHRAAHNLNMRKTAALRVIFGANSDTVCAVTHIGHFRRQVPSSFFCN